MTITTEAIDIGARHRGEKKMMSWILLNIIEP